MTLEKLYRLVSIGIVFISNIIFGQSYINNLKFNPISENVSQRAITSIIKDQKGIIWIGTKGDGIYSYNGLDLKNYRHEWGNKNTLNNSGVNSIYLDSNKNIWVGTDVGLNLYIRELDQFVPVKIDSLNSKIEVKAIGENEHKLLLIGTHGSGVFKLNSNTKKVEAVKIKAYDNLNKLQVNDIKITPRGSVLIGTNIGLLKYNSLNHEIDYANFTTIGRSKSIKSSVETILTKLDGSIWLGTTNEGLIEIATNPANYFEFKNHKITNKRILSLEINNEGAIFCGTENDGLLIFDNNEIIKSMKFNKSDTESTNAYHVLQNDRH